MTTGDRFSRLSGADEDSRTGVRLRWWGWASFSVAIFVLAIAGVFFAPAGSPVAVWWPAAGVAVLVGLLAGPERWIVSVAVVFAITTAANAVAGRPLAVAVLFGIANAAEVAVVLLATGSHRRRFRLHSLRRGMQFIVAVAAGGMTAGLIAAATVAAVTGDGILRTALFVAASHAAAVLVIAPFGALPAPLPRRRAWAEVLVHSLVLVATVALVFSPGATLPLTFLPYPILAWAAFRFPLPIVASQLLLASITILALTLSGGGPFAVSTSDIVVSAGLVEVYLVTFTGSAVVLASAQYELRDTSRRLDVSARLLSGAIIDAQVGLVAARRVGDGHVALWRNTAAVELLGGELRDDGVWRGPVAESAREALATGLPLTVEIGGRVLTVAANPVDEEDASFAVQISDVTAPVRAQQLRAEAERARADALLAQADLDRQREDFVATTSHELRTPVTSILGYLELLSESDGLSEREVGWLGIVDRNARRLLALIEDLLTLGQAREDSDRPQQSVAVAELLDEARSNLTPLVAERSIRLKIDVGDTVVNCNPDDALRAITNLLTNALKFTPPGGAVQVRSSRTDGGRTLVQVDDSGPGMTDYALAHAFDRFFRAPEAEASSVPGTGLGLPIVRELMHRNGGSVTLQRSLDGGLQATLIFR